MHEPRPPFPDAIADFRRFLTENNWSDKLRWLSAADITGYRNYFWVYRPTELANEKLSEDFYTEAIATASSVRIDAIFQHAGFTLAWVQDYGGGSGYLNYGILTSRLTLTAVTSRLPWHIRKAINRLRGESPMLQETAIPKCA